MCGNSFLPEPEFFRQNASQILHIEISAEGSQTCVIALALERMLLICKHAALHSVLGLLHNEESVPQWLALPTASKTREIDYVIESMATDMFQLCPRVLVTTFATDVNQDLSG